METDTSIKEGYLLFPPHGVLGQLKFQKSWHKKYCQLFKASQHGIERLEIFDSEEESRKSSSLRIITLENCVKISQDSQKPQPFVFMVVTKTLTYYFAAVTHKDMLDWIVALQSVAFRCDTTKQTVEEDNELYCTSGEGVFSVKVIPTEASRRCGLNSGTCTLIALESEIQLMNPYGTLLTWPYRYIRRYGHSEGIFTFEAGRKCPSGAGSFQFEHVYGVDVFRCISSRMKNMRKLLNAGSTGELSPIQFPSQDTEKINNVPLHLFWTTKSDESGNSITASNAPTVCVDEILQAAVNNMEAGSRSPLSAMPPFGSGLSTNAESANSALEDLGVMKIKPLKIGFKPAKPPRKGQPTSPVGMPVQQRINDSPSGKSGRLEYAVIASEPDPGDLHPYDKVEIRKDAWRTMGLNDLPHSESSPNIQEGDVNPSKERKKLPEPSEMEPIQSSKSSKIIVPSYPQSPDEENYDKLQHLGTQSSKRSGGETRYKQVTPLTFGNLGSQTSINMSSPVENESPSHQTSDWNDYDVVEDCMQAVRLADDSHLGYGMIRKKVLDCEDSSNVSKPGHTYYNDLEYAVIDKPKKSSPKH